jgi:uncharacterized membrane protein
VRDNDNMTRYDKTTGTRRYILAAWWNVLICSSLNIGFVVMAITTTPFALLALVAGVLLEVAFVRALRRVQLAQKATQTL